MVFIMNNNNYISSILTLTILFTVITAANSPSFILSSGLVYATTQQEEDESFENSEFTEGDEGSETTQVAIDSEQTEGSDTDENNNDNGNDLSSPDQNNNCPDTSDLSNVPTFIGKDGCQYPCLSPDNNGQGNIPQSCTIELPSQSSSGFSINEERPIQSQQQQQTTEQPLQQNTQTNPIQNTLTGQRIGSDTTTTTTTTSNIPNTETTTSTKKSFDPAGQLRSGSGQSELRIPGKSDDLAGPLTPGAGNAEVEGIPSQPNTNPQTPIDPENIPTKVEDRWAHLVVYSNFTNPNRQTPIDAEVCVYISYPYEIKANPYCIEGSFDGTLHLVQAPGLVGIRASSSFFDTIDTSNCEFEIYPKESKSCVVNFINSSFLKSKSEISEQDRLRTPIG